MSQATTQQNIQQFLARHTTLTLATVTAEGHPQAASLFFAEAHDLSLIFISEPKSRHSQNIRRNNRVAVTIYADGQQWQNIRGLQMEGTCTPLAGQSARTARNVYLQKFPFIQKNTVLLLMLNKVTFYQITPAWIRFIDNTQGFGHKAEIRLPPQPED